MSAALINRSLTTIKTELEFLRDSEVITEELYNGLERSLPAKYQKDMAPWGIDKLGSAGVKVSEAPVNHDATDKLSEDLNKTSLASQPSSASPPRLSPEVSSSKAPEPLGYCKALYDYQAQESGDLNLHKDEKVAILEHLSEDWWKGYKKGEGRDRAGVFPSNYVTVVSQQEFEFDRQSPALPKNEKASYELNQQQFTQPPPQYYDQQALGPQQLQPQSSYGGYAQYPPPSANYSPNPMQAQQSAEGQLPLPHPHLRKFGGKLGNAAIFGAGATIGSDIVNSIF
ncbi:uncharacterized protein PRCAT00005367001 [Priceomyces carsonii]|uniref:uncharacterized protein n=1 Tax=Priceomyces carsonii TaxID=28549 RepID=UPI002ED7F7F5|nr:unnamed protein product [Priceomyces carsonii]